MASRYFVHNYVHINNAILTRLLEKINTRKELQKYLEKGSPGPFSINKQWRT